MDPHVAALLDRDRIREVVTRLFVRTDQRDWPAVRTCFAPQVRFDMTSLAGGEPATLSPEEITRGWEEGLRPLAAIHHQMGNLLVEVRGGQADAFCYAIACHYLPNPSGRNTRTLVGSYDVHLIRHAGGWLIDAFRFNLKYVEGNPELEAAAGS